METPEVQKNMILATDSVEQSLSPEIMEVIMAKVQDINEPETGVHSISQHKKSNRDRLDLLEDEMKQGILGNKYPFTDTAYDKRGWLEEIKKRKGMFLFFNIIGRDIKTVENSAWINKWHCRDPVAILFDISNLKEVDLREFTHKYDDTGNICLPALEKYSTKTFGTHGINYSDVEIEKPPGSGNFVVKNIPGPDNGYALNFRVSPRFFKGVVFRLDREVTEPDRKLRFEEIERRILEYKEKYPDKDWWNYGTYDRVEIAKWEFTEDTNEINIQKRVEEIVARMRSALTSREDRLVPVYDVHGNLWWPNRMSYEEVKKMVQERKIDLSQQGSLSPENG